MASSILIADDEPAVRELLFRELSTDTCRVTLASDGREALECLTAEPFDLLIVDILMPEVDGLEVLQALRGRGLNTRVLAMTGVENRVYLDAAQRLGADRVMIKPVSATAMKQTVAELLA